MAHQRFCEVRILENENHRYGLFAIADIRAGEEILSEFPIAACPTPDLIHENKHCDFCLRGLETPEDYVRRICENGLNRVARPLPAENLGLIHQDPEYYTSFLRRVSQEVPPMTYPLIMCEAGCQTIYCSRDCKNEAWNKYHGQICPGMDVRRTSKLVELRNSWRVSQSQVPVKMFDVGILLNIIGSQTYQDFWIMLLQLNGRQSAIPALPETDTREFLRQVFGPSYYDLLDLIRQYCELKGISIISCYDTNRVMTHSALLKIIHGVLMTSMEVKGSVLSSFNEQYKLNSTQGPQDFQPKGDLLLLKKMNEELASSQLTGKEFNHSGYGIFRSMLYLRRSDVLQNSDASISHDKTMLKVTALKDIKAGDEIIIGEVPQGILTQWKATLEPENPERGLD